MNKKIFGMILLGIASLNLTGCEKVEAYKLKLENFSQQSKDSKDNEEKYLNMNEDILMEHYTNGKYSIKFENVKKTDKRNAFVNKEVEDVIILSYSFENYSVPEQITISEGIEFKVFDNNNNLLEIYPIPNETKSSSPCSPGSSSSGSIALSSIDKVESINIIVYNQEETIGYINVPLENN